MGGNGAAGCYPVERYFGYAKALQVAAGIGEACKLVLCRIAPVKIGEAAIYDSRKIYGRHVE